MLIALAGLPAAGKSSVASGLGRMLPAPVVSVDPIEAALWRAGVERAQPTGLAAYIAAEAVADGILALGQSVIVDAVNAVEPAREQWRELAARRGVPLAFVEVVCSSPELHRARLAARRRDIAGFDEPTWDDVERRRAEFAPWSTPRLTLDSAADLPSNIDRAIDYVSALA
jgi:predicted kinase